MVQWNFSLITVRIFLDPPSYIYICIPSFIMLGEIWGYDAESIIALFDGTALDDIR